MAQPQPEYETLDEFLNGGLTEHEFRNDDEKFCPICYEDYNPTTEENIPPEKPTRIKACGHVFGACCIRKHLYSELGTKRKCPICMRILYGDAADASSNPNRRARRIAIPRGQRGRRNALVIDGETQDDEAEIVALAEYARGLGWEPEESDGSSGSNANLLRPASRVQGRMLAFDPSIPEQTKKRNPKIRVVFDAQEGPSPPPPAPTSSLSQRELHDPGYPPPVPRSSDHTYIPGRGWTASSYDPRIDVPFPSSRHTSLFSSPGSRREGNGRRTSDRERRALGSQTSPTKVDWKRKGPLGPLPSRPRPPPNAPRTQPILPPAEPTPRPSLVCLGSRETPGPLANVLESVDPLSFVQRPIPIRPIQSPSNATAAPSRTGWSALLLGQRVTTPAAPVAASHSARSQNPAGPDHAPQQQRRDRADTILAHGQSRALATSNPSENRPTSEEDEVEQLRTRVDTISCELFQIARTARVIATSDDAVRIPRELAEIVTRLERLRESLETSATQQDGRK